MTLGNHARCLGPLAALLLTFSGGIASAEPEQAAVVATEATDVDAASLARVLEETRSALAGTALESRLTPQAAQAALEAAGLRPRACGLAPKCIAKLGKALQVRYVVAVCASRIAESSALSIALVDVERGLVIGRKDRSSVAPRELPIAARQLSAEVVPAQLKVARTRLTITSNAVGASVFVDGAEIGRIPLAAPAELPVGTHEVALEREGYQPYHSTVSLKADREESLYARLFLSLPEAPESAGASTAERAPEAEARETASSGFGASRVAALTTGAVGVAALGVGVGFGLAMRKDEQSFLDLCRTEYGTDCAGLDELPWKESEGLAELRASARRKSLIATGAFALAGAAAIATGALLYFGSDDSAPTASGLTGIAVLPSAGGITFGAEGAF